MADDKENRGVAHLALERIARRYSGRDPSRLAEFIEQEHEAEHMGEIIERLIEAIQKAEAKGMSRYQLSQRTGIPQSTLSRLMNRERDSLKVETVETLCRELGFVLEMRPAKKGRK